MNDNYNKILCEQYIGGNVILAPKYYETAFKLNENDDKYL